MARTYNFVLIMPSVFAETCFYEQYAGWYSEKRDVWQLCSPPNLHSSSKNCCVWTQSGDSAG